MNPLSASRARALRRRRAPAPRGSVLLLVLVVIAVLSLGAGAYLDLMQTEHRAVRRHGRAAQAQRLAESGVEYLKAFLKETPARIQLRGGLLSNTTGMYALLAADQPDPFERGRFTILAPDQINGLYSGVRYGLENESAKINLNVLLAEGAEATARERLLVLPGMTPDVADAILDWIDADGLPRPFGAEQEYYTGLNPPYAPRNGPLAALDELLLVRGVTPELLYGLDQNRNMFVEPDELPRGALVEIDNADGSMNRGWSAYLTLTSVELMGGNPAAPLADLNSGDLQSLYNTLKTVLTDEQARFIVLYRQYGAPPQNNAGQPPRGAAPGAAAPPGGAANTPPPGAPAADPVSAASIELNFQQPGGTQIASLLDLVGVQVQVPATPPGGAPAAAGNPGAGNPGASGNNSGDSSGSGGGNNNGNSGGPPAPPPKTVASPWRADPNSYRELLKLYDAASVVNQGRIAGRVNINSAARPVLLSIPNLPLAAVDQIVARRELEPNPTLSTQRHALWLLVEGIVTLDQMRQIERFVTARGDAFSGQSVGFFDADPAPVRCEFILDRSTGTPRLRAWRDLAAYGPGFSPEVLGAEGEEAR